MGTDSALATGCRRGTIGRRLGGRRPCGGCRPIPARKWPSPVARPGELAANSRPDRTVRSPHSRRVEVRGVSTDPVRDSEPGRTGPTVTVSADPESVARGVTALAAAHDTTRPARSHPAHRPRPPVIELGEEALPPGPGRAQPATSLELLVPRSLAALFVTAPLAYYCCATVRVTDRDRPVLRDREAGLRHDLSPLPTLQGDSAGLLRRTFFLDCLVRELEGPPAATSGPGLEVGEAGATTPADLGLDPAALRGATPGERLRRYLAVRDERVDDLAPAWHLASYVAPRPEYVHCLSHLLDALSLVYLPRASRCDSTDILSHTLDDALCTRGGDRGGTRLKPALDGSHVHAWLAPGTPMGAFKATPGAYRHRRSLESSRREAAGVVKLVLTDPDMAAEAEAVREAYRGAPAVDSLETHDEATRADVRAALSGTADLVHYVGHCDEAGLRCRDGWLDATSLSGVGSPAFILNGCGSYEQGLSLLDAGSVAGVVTVGDVLDDHARTVGATLARLLLRGFELSRATHLARRRILMGADYVVVGDGTFRVYDPSHEPTVLRIERDAHPTERRNGEPTEGPDGALFRVRSRSVATDRTGHAVDVPLAAPPTLNGDEVARNCDRAELLDLLETVDLPVIFESDLWWSTALRADLTAGDGDILRS